MPRPVPDTTYITITQVGARFQPVAPFSKTSYSPLKFHDGQALRNPSTRQAQGNVKVESPCALMRCFLTGFPGRLLIVKQLVARGSTTLSYQTALV